MTTFTLSHECQPVQGKFYLGNDCVQKSLTVHKGTRAVIFVTDLGVSYLANTRQSTIIFLVQKFKYTAA